MKKFFAIVLLVGVVSLSMSCSEDSIEAIDEMTQVDDSSRSLKGPSDPPDPGAGPWASCADSSNPDVWYPGAVAGESGDLVLYDTARTACDEETVYIHSDFSDWLGFCYYKLTVTIRDNNNNAVGWVFQTNLEKLGSLSWTMPQGISGTYSVKVEAMDSNDVRIVGKKLWHVPFAKMSCPPDPGGGF
jgi:hypothetical protein